MDPITRQGIERRIIERAVTDLLFAGLHLRVFDGEEWATDVTRDFDVIMDALFSTDEDKLYCWRDLGPGHELRYGALGYVHFVYGNDGYDVIADNTLELEPYLAGPTALADVFETRGATVLARENYDACHIMNMLAEATAVHQLHTGALPTVVYLGVRTRATLMRACCIIPDTSGVHGVRDRLSGLPVYLVDAAEYIAVGG